MPEPEPAVVEVVPDQVEGEEGRADREERKPEPEEALASEPGADAEVSESAEQCPVEPEAPAEPDSARGENTETAVEDSPPAPQRDDHDGEQEMPVERGTNLESRVGRAGTVIQIAKLEKGSFGTGLGSDQGSDEPTDPTKPHPARPRKLPILASADDIATWELELAKRRILVLGCHHDRVLHAVTFDLLEGPLLQGHEKRLLDFDLLKGHQEAELALHSLAEIKVGRGSECVVVVTLKSKLFLDSMFRDLALLLLTEQLLAKKQSYILVRVSDSEILETFDQKLEECDEVEDDRRYYFARVRFIEGLLVMCRQFSKDRALDLARQIETQWKAGLWGDPTNELELIHSLRTLLKEGPRRLEEVVEARSAGATGEGTLEVRGVIETADAAELFEKADDVGRTVLFAVAKFPGLHPHEFERLMGVLLAQRTAEIEVTEEELDAEGSVRKVTRMRTRDLMDLWREAPDGALFACQVQAMEQEDGSDTMDFVWPYLRRDLLRALRQHHPLFLRQRLERILQAGLLFEENGRSRLREGAIGLAVEIALADPGRFDERWLTRHVLRLEAATGVELNDQETEEFSEGELFQLFVKLAENAELRRRVLSGLSDLIREMLRHERLQSLVEAWLDGLLRSRRHGQALVFVLDIFKALRFTPRFDVLHWFRRLLDETPDDSRDEVYKALLRSAIDLKLRIYDLLEPLGEWLPEPGASDPPKRPSTRYALQLMADYCYHTLSEFEAEKAGAWPSSYALFAVLREDVERTDARLRMLVEWLLHPSMKWIATEEDADVLVESLWTFRAAVIEEWYWVLKGGGAGDGAVPERAASSVADGLLKHLLALTSLEDRSRLLECWRTWRADYLEEAGSPGEFRSEVRHNAKLRRKCSMRLERRLKELHLERKRG